MPAVSVILPVVNAATTLERALSSILEQTMRDIELIAIDDGSTDESARILARCAAQDSRVKVLLQAHSGIVRALQTGLAAAESPFVARMDADDWSAPARLEKQSRFLCERPELGAVGCLVRFGGDVERSAGYATHVEWINGVLTPTAISENRFVEAPFAHPSVMFRTELVTRFGGYKDGDFPEDYELWLRWLDAGVAFGKVPEPLLTWNDPPSRLSRSDKRYSFDAFYRLKAFYLARWLERCNPFHPEVVIAGSGRVTRRRVETLMDFGVNVCAYLDIDRKKIGRSHHGAPVIGYDDLPQAGKHFVLGYVGKRGVRELIAEQLKIRGYRIGLDWLPAA